MVLGLYSYRAFIWRHARADLRHRYAGTGMGIAWNVIHPLAVITIYSVVFSNLFPSPPEPGAGHLPYTFYLCAGFFPWMAFSDCVTRGCNSFLVNAAYLKKLPIPEQVFVAQNAASSSLSLAINFVLLLVVAVVLGWTPGWTWVLLPIPLLCLQALGFGTGLLLGTLNVFFRDIAEWVDISLKLLMWTVPIVYKVGPDRVRFLAILQWHPLYPALKATRDLFLDHRLPQPHDWAAMFLWPVGITAIALAVLGKLRPEIRDVI
jgi:ABC-type polysaccharide/polyol phosphate export permease